MPIQYQSIDSTHSQLNNTNEQTVFTFTPIVNNIVKGIWLDLTNLTQNITIRIKYTVDSSNLRTFQSITWHTGLEDGVLIEGEFPVAVNDSLSLTLQSIVVEGANRDIPFKYFTEGLGSGAVAFTYTVTNSITGNTIGGVEIWVTTDLAGSNIIASGLTNDNGQVIFYLEDQTTYYFWRKHPNFTFVNPDTETINI